MRNSPVLVGVGTTVELIAASGGWHACASLTNDQIQCWGQGNHGQLGIGNTASHNTPQTVTGLTTVAGTPARLTVESHSSCVTFTDGTLECWGWNQEYQLGDGTGTNRYSPIVIDLGGTPDISVVGDMGSWGTSCYYLTDGNLKCWGRNFAGQVGNGAAGAAVQTPTIITV